MVLRLVLVLSLACSFVSVSSAQRRTPPTSPPSRPIGGSRDIQPGLGVPNRTCELVIHVVLPNDRPVQENVGVSLESAHGGIISQYVTDSQGEVTFRGINPGNYVVRVSGGNLKDTTSGTIMIDSFATHHVEYVHAEPVQSEGASSVTSKQGSVSAAALNVPEKARKEFNKGNESLAKGDNAKATEHYLKAVEICPKYAMAYNNLGAVYMKSDDKAHAREAWSKALDADPNLDSANVNVAKLDILDHNYAGAIAPLEKALAVQPKSAEALLLMSEAQFVTKDYSKAILYARKVHELDHQKYEMAHIVAARALEAQNRPGEAKIEYEVLLKENPAPQLAAEARQSLARLEKLAKER